jgi:hypothetical protein
MSVAVWVVGEACIGKSTLIRSLMGTPVGLVDATPQVRFTTYADVSAIGVYRGADEDGPRVNKLHALHALDWWRVNMTGCRYLLMEGEHFMSWDAYERLQGHTRLAIQLEGVQLARERRFARGLTAMRTQAAAGRATADRWALHFPGPVMRLHPDLPPDVLGKTVREWLDGHDQRS